jgi:hypothetical protein
MGADERSRAREAPRGAVAICYDRWAPDTKSGALAIPVWQAAESTLPNMRSIG